jgi:diguanylate cyclase (GGDEF)-like protein/PAS domain S-box-containing protein
MPAPDAEPAGDELVTRQLGNLMPYAAVVLALLTSSVEVLRNGRGDLMISWVRTTIMVLLVLRQVLALRENNTLTRTLEDRVLRRTAELEQSRERFASMVRHSSDVVTVVDGLGVVQYQSASSERVLGYLPEQLEGCSVYDLPSDDTERVVLATALEHAAAEDMRLHTLSTTWRHADGRLCRMEVTVTNLLGNPHVRGLVLNSRDVTDRVALEEQLTGMAFTDSLTGLANRALFKDRLQHALGRSDPRRSAVSVLFLDLDGFKSVNDMIGHSAGDALLVQVADRLRSVCAPGDTVARFGGDEFAVLLEDQPDDVYQTALAERIGAVIREPFDLQGERVHVTTSVGIAAHDEHATTAEQLLRNADLAMYQAKGAGNGGYVVFEPAMHAGLVERVRLESDLRQAVENGEFVVHYQPMVSMRTGAITGSEALVRWQHPTRGLLAPGEFVAVAEATGLIRAIGDFVLREACAQTVRWQQAGGTDLRISVNVSPRQLLEADYADQVRAALEDTGLAPQRLTLEMTESVLIDDRPETLDALTALHNLGIRLAIDDFGTGYSSLSYLHRFPVDVLKIDRSFVERLGGGEDGGDGTLVSTILHLGHSLQLETVAEGIERPQEMLILRRQGCTTGQGFHFSPPVAADVIGALLREQATSTPVA